MHVYSHYTDCINRDCDPDKKKKEKKNNDPAGLLGRMNKIYTTKV